MFHELFKKYQAKIYFLGRKCKERSTEWEKMKRLENKVGKDLYK